MKRWYETGIINDIRTSWKSCFLALFCGSIEEIAEESVKQHIKRERKNNEPKK